MPSGIITKGIGGFYYVKTQNAIYECKAKGIFRKDKITPLPGDKVSISIIDEDKKIGNVDEIKPRDSELVRPAVANVNQIAIVVAIKSPDPDFNLLDKLLITARLKNIIPVIVINKIDLDDDDEHKKVINAYENTCYKTIVLSSKYDLGFDVLADAMKDRITVFAGQSGVGKSTILNRIFNMAIMKTGEISNKIERGKHTTRHAELIELETGGYVVDSPGFSSFELANVTHDEIERYYPDFTEYLNTCKFARCSHINEPCCAVKNAVEDGKIDLERYYRYSQIYNALKKQNDNRYRKQGK